MQSLEHGDKVLGAGDFEQGKTVGLCYLAELHDQVIAFDPEGELDPYDPKLSMRPERWTQVHNVRELADADTPCISVNVNYTELDNVCGVALENLQPGLAVVLLEFSRSVPGTSPSAIPDNVSTLWRTAHKDDTSVLCETHRTNEIPKICRRADHFLAWRLPDDDAQDFADAASLPELAYANRLPERHYLHGCKKKGGSVAWRKPFPPRPPR